MTDSRLSGIIRYVCKHTALRTRLMAILVLLPVFILRFHPRPLPHVYRRHVRCPECISNWIPKDGASEGHQVYHCGDCGRRAIPDAACQRPGAAGRGCW